MTLTIDVGAMKKRTFINSAVLGLTQLDEGNADEFEFECWHTRQVLNWIRGIDNSISSYLRLFTQNQLNGSFLNGLTDEQLRRLGITKGPIRRLILQATNLLSYYSFDIKTENVQKLAFKVIVSVQNLINAIDLATPIINSPKQSSRSLVVLNTVLVSVAEIHESVTKLVFCLDRHPFNEKKEFVSTRNCMANFIKEMIEAIDPNNKQFFAVPQLLVHLSQKIQELARELIYLPDSCIIETPYIQRVILYGCRPNDWGMEFRATSEGIFLITAIDANSPNFSAQKVHVGDEIVEINRQAVIGWKYANVLKKMESAMREVTHGYELDITICKRPRESWMNLILQKPRSQSPSAEKGNEDQKRMVMDFKNKIQPELLSRHSLKNKAVKRGRSASFSNGRDLQKQSSLENERVRNESLHSTSTSTRSPTSLITLGDKRPIFRRASVWTESPPTILRSPFDRLHATESNAWLLLLVSWGEVSGNRQNNYFHSRHTTRLPPQQDDNTIEEDSKEMNVETDYEEALLDEASVCIITSDELDVMDIKTTGTDDTEWSTPAKEDITGCKIALRVHLERGPSVSNIDSPLSAFHAKITKFLYGNDAELPNNSISTSFSEKAEGSVTPITPLSKVFQDLVFYTPPKIQQHFSPVTVDSPNSMSRSVSPQSPHSHTSLSRVMNIVSKRTRLAPLAEPDETSDLDESDHNTTDLPKKSISNDDMFGYLLEKCARIPVNDLINKLHEGWIRRQRITDDDLRTIVKRNSQWVKCWLVLTKTYLLVYSNQDSKEADIVFELKRCSITSIVLLKTSKQHTFEIVWNNGRLCFAPYTGIDLNCWFQWITDRCTAFGDEKNSHLSETHSGNSTSFSLDPVYVRSVENNSDSSMSSTASGSKVSSRVNQFKPTRILSRLSRRSFSRPHYYATISSGGTPSSPISNVVQG